tara:strand:+ start:2139 stop:5006 length:2868 start_codon:yes stop_codon:yes gene_type:complete
MDSITKGFPQVSLSITNPDVSNRNALDKFTPFSFLDFIENVTQSYAPETLTAFYSEYINRWNDKTTAQPVSNDEIIIARYRDFLKDITLNFSSNAEKKFLTQIDFTDPYDLEIAMSFFSSKIRHIVSYYKKKRDILHYATVKARVKGSNLGLEQAAKDLIINFLENRETANIDYDIDDIKENLSVDLTEFFDNYSEYFNSEPDALEYGKNYIAYEDLPIAALEGKNLFLWTSGELVNKIFGSVSQDIRKLKEANQLFHNKKRQAEKFIGTDFYYLSTDSNGKPDVGVLFEADKPYANFLNQNYPSTASVFSDDIISERNLGFFRPQNSSIVAIEGERLKYFENVSYDSDQLYIFPDPNLFTNNQDIFTFVIDTSRSINNRSKGIAVNQPNTDKNSTSFIGYNSQIGEKRDLNTDLSYLYNEGYIADSKKDLFGNIFGLVKDYNYYRSNVEFEDPDTIKSLIFNGYEFYDDLYGEGYNFDYATVDSATFSETIRSGLTSFTNGLTALGDNTPNLPLSTYNIFFRYFDPYQTLLQPSNFLEVDYGRPESMEIDADVKDGAYFMFSDTELLADPMRSGLSAYTDSTAQFYFSDLVDAGIGYSDATPMGATIFRALCDNTNAWTRNLSGNFSFNVRLSGDNGVKNYDGMRFTDNIVFNYAQASQNFDYRDEVYSTTSYSTVATASESMFDSRDYLGKIYVKNVGVASDAPAVKELTQALSYLSTNYNSAIVNELSTSVTNFDILYDTLFIETSSYLVTERTKYKQEEFISPGIFTNSLNINTDFFDKVSNRLKVNNNVYYCRMARDQLDYKDTRLYPEIFEYNYVNEETIQIFPTTTNTVISGATCYFNLSTDNIVYLECSKPILTYSSDNEQFNLAVILKDQNKGPLLINYRFEYTDDINFLGVESYTSNNSRFTYNFIDTDGARDLSSLRFVLSSALPSLTATYVSPIPLSAAALIL